MAANAITTTQPVGSRTQVTRLDGGSLDVEVVAGGGGGGGLAPLEIQESASTGFAELFGEAFFLKQNGGPEIECAFAAWLDLQILRVEASWQFGAFDGAAGAEANIAVLVSVNGGVSWQLLAPTAAQVGVTGGNSGLLVASAVVSVELAAAATVQVRLVHHFYAGAGKANSPFANGMMLRCERYAPASYVAAGSLQAYTP